MVIQDRNESVTVPFKVSGCMVNFEKRLPIIEEVESLKQYCLTQSDTP
jgi:hypothetical protein